MNTNMGGRPQPKAKYQLLLENSGSSFDARRFIVAAVLIISVICATTIAAFLLWENVKAVEDTEFLLDLLDVSKHHKFSTEKGERLSYFYSTSLRRAMDSSTEKSSFLIGEIPVQLGTKKNSMKLVCYYGMPNNASDLQPDQIDPFLCTHINIGFAVIYNGSIAVSLTQSNVYRQVVALKILNPSLKVLLSIGGGSEDTHGIAHMVSRQALRKSFIKFLVSFLSEYSFDGVDFDWEFPAWESDSLERPRFANFLKELREEIDRHQLPLLVSVAVAAPQPIVDRSYDVRSMAKSVDFVNVMAYDYHVYVWYSPLTGINSPLYHRSQESGYLQTLNVNFTVWYWMSKGMPAEKIVLGLPTYGHSFTLLNVNNVGINAPSSGYGILGKGGFINYPCACWFIKDGKATSVFDNETRSPFAYQGREWISFDNEESLSHKAQYVMDSRLGGAMIFSLNADDHSGECSNGKTTFPLTRQVGSVLQDDQL